MEVKSKAVRSAYFFGELNLEEEIKVGFTEETVKSFRALKKRLTELEKTNTTNSQIVLFFIGSDDKNGKSWCADCNVVDDIMVYVKEMINPTGFLIRVHVGDRADWLRKDNPFKTDPKLHIRQIPSIWVLNTLKRVSGRKLIDLETLIIMLED